MKSTQTFLDPREIQSRAAKVRQRWSIAERIRRTGLPPDTPTRLRDWAGGRREPGRKCPPNFALFANRGM